MRQRASHFRDLMPELMNMLLLLFVYLCLYMSVQCFDLSNFLQCGPEFVNDTPSVLGDVIAYVQYVSKISLLSRPLQLVIFIFYSWFKRSCSALGHCLYLLTKYSNSSMWLSKFRIRDVRRECWVNVRNLAHERYMLHQMRCDLHRDFTRPKPSKIPMQIRLNRT